MVATPGSDVLFGTSGADVIDGLAGDDVIWGFDPTGGRTEVAHIRADRVGSGRVI